MPTYTYATLTQAIQELANRLYDPTMQFYSSAELQSYITESLRSWNSHANFWRAEFTFPSRTGIVWYDFTDTTNLPNTLRPLTVTDQDIYSLIEYHLLEPQTPTYPLTWLGSKQFTLDDMMQAVQRRRDEILSITGCTLAIHTVAANPGRTTLGDKVLDIRRVAWLPVTNPAGFVATPLLPGDNLGEGYFAPGYTASPGGTPGVYMQSAQPPLSFDVDTPPGVNGQYECLTVDAGTDLTAASSTVMNIPDDFSWIIKWGSLADLLSRDSEAQDIPRARYCELRYRQGISLLLESAALLQMRLNNITLQVEAAIDADRYNPGWQAAAQGTPSVALVAGLNLVGLASTPDAGPYSLTASVVENAPVPVVPGDFIQLGRDDYDVMLDEAQHIASFKMGGAEFTETFPLHERFLKQAAIYNQKLAALGQFQKEMYRMSQDQEDTNPRLASPKVVTNG